MIPTRLLVAGARAAQIGLCVVVGWIVGRGVGDITEPWIDRLKTRDLITGDAVRYTPQPETEVSDQERLDRVEAELAEEADA